MPRSSPPKHRHDGTSPLPMGMDWSPPPKRWEGGNTVWPHDPRTGWSYCVMIPSWVVQPESGASTDSLLNPIIFYRVLVGIQSPEGVSTSRGILRRFSDFLKLFSAIRKALPRKSIPAAPSKHALVRINSSRLLLEERRRSLEEWMGKLLSDIDVSRSAPVAAFLELEAAVRSSFQDVDTQSLEQSPSNGAIAMPSSIAYRVSSGVSVADSPAAATKYQSVASDFGSDYACETPDLGTPRQDRHHISENGGKDWVSSHGSTGNVGALANGVLLGESCSEQPDDLIGRKLHHHKEKLVLENDHVYAKCSKEVTLSTDGQEFMSEQSYDKLWGHARKHSEESIGSDVSSIRGSELMNSGVNNLVGDGSTDLHGGDAQSAIKTHSSETQYLNDEQLIVPLDQRHKLNRILLTMQRRLVMAKNDMDNLIARLNQEVAVKEYLATKVKDLEGELEATKQKSKENLQQAILIEKERITQMQWDMDELRRKYMENESRLKFEQDEKTRVESEKTTASGEKDLLLQELGTKQGQLETLQKRLVDLEGKSRSDVKVLAKEIKMLRSSQTELKEALNQTMKEKTKLEKFIQKDNQRWANVKAARKKLLHECEVLRHQLQECSVNFLADEKDKFNVSSTSLSDSLDLLATSDDRINLLLAEVQLLAQNDEHATDVDRTGCSNSTDTLPIDGEGLAGTDDDEIRNILTDLLVDNATLRKQINSVVQCSLQTIFKPASEETDESPSSKTVLNTFLER